MVINHYSMAKQSTAQAIRPWLSVTTGHSQAQVAQDPGPLRAHPSQSGDGDGQGAPRLSQA